MSPRPLPYFSLTTRMAIALESKLQSIAAIRNPSSNWMARTSLPPTPATRNETGVLFSRLDIGLYDNSRFLSGDLDVPLQSEMDAPEGAFSWDAWESRAVISP